MELYLAPVGAGKTDYVQTRIADLKAKNPFASVWVLLATERQIIDFRRRLLARQAAKKQDSAVYFNVEFFSFYNLYERILMLAGKPQRRLYDAGRYGVIRAVLTELSADGKLPLLGAVAQTNGFVRITADFIYELKQNLIDPDLFANAADSAADPKLKELALIYAAYQDVLVTNRLVDREGEGWVALSALAQSPSVVKFIDLLIVDGYDQFNPLQARLLTHLGGLVGESILTLTTVPGREQTLGRRFERALERLEQCHKEENFPYEITRLDVPTGSASQAAPALRHLSSTLLTRQAPEYTLPTENITLIEAPDEGQEAAAVLRQVKRLLLDGVKPDDILIAVRDWTRYGRYFGAYGRSFGLPLLLHHGEPLIENPAIAALVNLLELHVDGKFRRRELLDALRSPYFTFPYISENGWADKIDQISRDYVVTADVAVWIEAIDSATAPAETATSEADDDEDREDERIKIPEAEAGMLKSALSMCFEALTPPPQHTTAGYIHWLETLIGEDSEPEIDDLEDVTIPGVSKAEGEESSTNGKGHHVEYSLGMIRRIREPLQTAESNIAQGIVERDLKALHEFKLALRSLLVTEGLLHSIQGLKSRHSAAVISWEQFWSALKTILAARSIQLGETGADKSIGRDGRVLVTTISDARGLPHPHVFILGLSEGIFPAPIAEDRVLLDSERTRLRRFGVSLTLSNERADEEGLFYEMLNLAGQSVTLSRPTVNNGAMLAESHLWRGVKAVIPHPKYILYRPGSVISLQEAASMGEAAVAAAQHMTRTASLSGEVVWLAQQSLSWVRIVHGRWVELTRMAREQRHDRYTGRLQADRAIRRAAALLDDRHVWSASQLNEYGQCPFRYFAKRMLNLEAVDEPEEGMDAAQLGTLYHAVLEQTYRQITEKGMTISPENANAALEILHDVMSRVLPSAPYRLRFRASSLWEREQAALRRRLIAYVEADFAGESPNAKAFGKNLPRTPYRLEASFGGAGDDARPIKMQIGEQKILVRGKIDRIDRVGDRLVVMDYKTGTTGISSSEISAGRNFQMLMYLKAAALLAGSSDDVAGGVFIHLANLSASGKVSLNDEDDQAILREGERHIERNLERGRSGDFAVTANKLHDGRCAHYCDYHQFCRVSIIHQRKT